MDVKFVNGNMAGIIKIERKRNQKLSLSLIHIHVQTYTHTTSSGDSDFGVHCMWASVFFLFQKIMWYTRKGPRTLCLQLWASMLH